MVTTGRILAGITAVRMTNREPRRVRMHPSAAIDLAHEAVTRSGGVWNWLPGQPQQVYGLDLDVDNYLPRDMFRLTNSDEALLYDSREGQPVP